MNKRTFVVLVCALFCLCAFLFYIFYNKARKTAIKHTNETQMVHAKVAARGIEEYFTTWIGVLNALSKTDDITKNNSEGKNFIKLLSEAHPDEILSINRLNEKGIIISSSDNRRIGSDLLGHKHIQELLHHHQTIISDVFSIDEGDNAISIQVPIFKGASFNGSICALIDF